MAAEDEKLRQRLADRVLAGVEDAIYWAVAALLVAGAVVVLISQVSQFRSLGDQPTSAAMLMLLDGLLLVFIFVELLFAVRACLRSHELVAEPFLIVGILACIKEIVVLSVEAATLLQEGPAFSRAVTQLGVLGGLVLLLSVSVVLIRVRREEHADADGARPGRARAA